MANRYYLFVDNINAPYWQRSLVLVRRDRWSLFASLALPPLRLYWNR